ncbi:MAG: hypothetical protein JRF72_08955 [Deltaproteobacteria bacterium]|nr:hypothetical protein [Deltaproteobacteria bacterium]
MSYSFFIKEIELVSEPRIMFEGKASIRFKNGAYTLVREHFGSACNAAIGHKMRL